MKKIGLAVVLLAVVIGVGYLSALRNQAAEKSRFQEGYAKGTQEVSVVKKEADSLRTVLEKHDLALGDSLRSVGTRYAHQADSLNGVIRVKDSMLVALRNRKTPVQAAKQQAKTSGTAPSKPALAKADALTHTQILDYYKRRLGQLPADLSDYERKVAVNEIREETAKKFSITPTDLDKLRQSSNVSE